MQLLTVKSGISYPAEKKSKSEAPASDEIFPLIPVYCCMVNVLHGGRWKERRL